MRAEPILKWAGGKRKLADAILERLGPIPDGATYVEPFVGGAAVFLAVRDRFPGVFCRLSDVNLEIANLYRTARDMPRFLIDELRRDVYRYEQEAYYAMRASEPTHPVAMAARTIYLNRCGYNGLYRTNLSGKFNVPFGRYTNPTICDEEGILAMSAALKGMGVERCDFSEATYPDGAYVYMDPPYLPTSKTAAFTSYSGAFGVEQQRVLAHFARSLVHRGCRVVLSNSDMPLIRELYGNDDFRIDEIEAARNVSCKGEKREKVRELIIVGRSLQ